MSTLTHTHSLYCYLTCLLTCSFALAKSQNVQTIRGHITRSAIKGHKNINGETNSQTERQIKLNNQPKFVSFLNLNSKQTTKQSLIIVSFAYFFSLLLRTLFLRSLSLSGLIYVSYFVPIPEEGRSINQLSNYAKYRHLSKLKDLVYIYTQYICDIIMYIDAVD